MYVHRVRVTKPLQPSFLSIYTHNPIIKSVNQGLRSGLTLSTWFIVICVIYVKLRRTVAVEISRSHLGNDPYS